jgi:DNA recombination protein Rad52
MVMEENGVCRETPYGGEATFDKVDTWDRKVAESLGRPLGPEYVSERPGPRGMKLNYLAHNHLVSILNQIFGYDGWSTRVVKVERIESDQQSGGGVGVQATVRVTLTSNGSFREDIGVGMATSGFSDFFTAYEKASKEAVTDAEKRACRKFGEALGLCLYDKKYNEKIGVLRKKSEYRNLHVVDMKDEKLLYRAPHYRDRSSLSEDKVVIKQQSPQSESSDSVVVETRVPPVPSSQVSGYFVPQKRGLDRPRGQPVQLPAKRQRIDVS